MGGGHSQQLEFAMTLIHNIYVCVSNVKWQPMWPEYICLNTIKKKKYIYIFKLGNQTYKKMQTQIEFMFVYSYYSYSTTVAIFCLFVRGVYLAIYK